VIEPTELFTLFRRGVSQKTVKTSELPDSTKNSVKITNTVLWAESLCDS